MSGAGSSVAMLVAAIADWRRQGIGRLVIAIDGHGAAGKTTLADELAREIGAAVVRTDDYFTDARASSDIRPMAQYYDWERLRQEALLPALAVANGIEAPLLIEGVSSACPALSDLVTHTVYVGTPEPLRLSRLHDRISSEEWDDDWLAAERVYFAGRPPESFDLVVPGAKITA